MKSLSVIDRLFVLSSRLSRLGQRLLLKSERPWSILCKTWCWLY